jgi:glycosyltransferase involved in cell wall biosynthesis
MLRNSNDLVASRQVVADDFAKFFNIKDSMKIHIFHFASVLDDFTNISFEDLRLKYKVPSKYFMVSNQFHPHKNHKVLLEAMVIVKAKGIVLNYVFTGRFANVNHTPFLKEILKIVEDNSLQSQVSFLGVIPRVDQLLLMKHSQAVLQPTLFEGWSTVIEDAISLQVPVIASNIPVNIEQLGKDGVYFNPQNPSDLADILFDFPQRNLEDTFYEKYEQRMLNAAKAFVRIFT